MKNNKGIGWYLDDAFSFSMDMIFGIVLLSLIGIVLMPLCLFQCLLAAAQCT